MLREMQREVNEGRPFEDRFVLISKTIIPSTSVHRMTLIVASWPFCHEENHLDPE